MVGWEFGVNDIKAKTNPSIKSSGWWWYNGVGDIFMSPLVPTECRLNSTALLLFLTTSLWPQLPAGSYTMPQSSNDFKLVSWHDNDLTILKWPQIVTRFESTTAPLGCGGTRESYRGFAAEKMNQLCDAIMSIWRKETGASTELAWCS